MAEYLIQDTTLDAIADAINAKTGGSSAMTPAQMVTEIGSISGGGTSFDWASVAEIVTVGANSVTNAAQARQYFLNYAPDLVILLSPMTRSNQMVWITSTESVFGRANVSLEQIELRPATEAYDAYLVEGTQYLVLKV